MEQDDPMNARTAGALSRHDVQGSRRPRGAAGDPVTSGLQQMFARIADEPIPEDFLRLLDDIEARSANDHDSVAGTQRP
jgi:hypothetical protein